MPRGCRSIILAACGWLILSASPPGHYAAPNQHKASSEIAGDLRGLDTTIKEANQAENLNKPCQHKATDTESQLCAQWQAADAGKASAIWAERTFWIGAAGAVVGFFALVAAGRAALFARDAVRETRRIGEAQTRAYLTVAKVTGFHSRNGLAFAIELRNSGQSPAIETVARCSITPPEGEDVFLQMHRRNETVPATSSLELPFLYLVNEEAKTWSGIVIKITVGFADVFENIFSLRTDYAGSPMDWGIDAGTAMISGHQIVTAIDAGVVNTKP